MDKFKIVDLIVNLLLREAFPHAPHVPTRPLPCAGQSCGEPTALSHIHPSPEEHKVLMNIKKVLMAELDRKRRDSPAHATEEAKSKLDAEVSEAAALEVVVEAFDKVLKSE
jgi:hypothetical protein